MKKFIALALIALLTILNPVGYAAIEKKIIPSTTLSASPTSATGTVYLGDAKRAGFLVDYDETDAGAALSVAVTCTISFDGTNFQSFSFYDIAGGTTLQSSETISADGRYYFWLDQSMVAPYLKVTVTATGSDSTHTAIVIVYAIYQQ